MKTLLTSFLLLIGISSYSQIYWMDNYDAARKVAMEEQKFIVMDFWATWCRPCVTMEHDMWSKPEMDSIAYNFVALKIDVDHNKDLAVRYGANSIPKVVLIDPVGNVVWSKIGYSTPLPYLTILENIPLSALPGDAVKKEIEENGNENSLSKIAASYQNLGKTCSSSILSNGFLNLSDRYYHKIEKTGQNEDAVFEAKLNLILNDAYRGRTKSAIKQISKLDGKQTELENYIMAYCYKCTGDKDKMKEFKDQISNPDLLAQLDE